MGGGIKKQHFIKLNEQYNTGIAITFHNGNFFIVNAREIKDNIWITYCKTKKNKQVPMGVNIGRKEIARYMLTSIDKMILEYNENDQKTDGK